MAANVAMSASLQMLWSMINVIQLIVKLPLLNVNFPQNAASFYNLITQMSSFNLIPTDKINGIFFNFTDKDMQKFNFQQMGLQKFNVIQNLESMVYYLFGILFLASFTLLLRFLKRFYKWIEVIHDYLAKKIFWNVILRLIIECYLDFAISSALNSSNLVWNTNSDKFASILSIIMLVGITIFPFLMLILLLRANQSTLNE